MCTLFQAEAKRTVMSFLGNLLIQKEVYLGLSLNVMELQCTELTLQLYSPSCLLHFLETGAMVQICTCIKYAYINLMMWQ